MSKHDEAVAYATRVRGDDRGAERVPEYFAFVAGWEAALATVEPPVLGVDEVQAFHEALRVDSEKNLGILPDDGRGGVTIRDTAATRNPTGVDFGKPDNVANTYVEEVANTTVMVDDVQSEADAV